MIGAVLKIALRALARNKGRSALTMLGIIIGVAARDRDGEHRPGCADAGAATRSTSMGTNLLIVSAGSSAAAAFGSGAGTTTT